MIDCCFCNSFFCSAEFQKRGDSNGVFGTFEFFDVKGDDVDDVVGVDFSPDSKVKNIADVAGDEFFGLLFLLLFAMIFWNIYILIKILLSLLFFYSPAFRSYKPVNDSLQEFVQPEPEIGEITDKVAEELKNENEGVVMESLVSVVLPETS